MTEEGLTEEQMEQYEGQQALQYGYPSPPSKDSIFKFFREILKLDDSRKVANLKEREIGTLRLPSRSYLDIASYADTEGLEKVSEYLVRKSEIISATSMGREGFLSKLFVTQIKKEQKVKSSGEVIKKGLFGNTKIVDEGTQ